MGISHEKWHCWLAVLEDILHEADVHGEHLIGIHINSAIDAVYAKVGTERLVPCHDLSPSNKGQT